MTALDTLNAKLHALAAAASASHRRATLCLVAACLILFLPGFFSLQPMDRDEPRFAQATKQMLETGDYVRIRFQQAARNNKPVGIYWVQAAAVRAGEALGVPDARRRIWLYRLASLFGAIAAVLLTYWAALAFAPAGQAMMAGLLLAATILLGVEARLAKTDALLLATIVAAMGAFARIYLFLDRDTRWRLPAIFWTAIGFGLLLKGPITPMVPLLAGLALAFLDRGAPWLRQIKAGPGVVWALLIALPWFVLIMIETKGAFLADSLGKDMLAKGRLRQGKPWRAATDLFRRLLGDGLADGAYGRNRRALSMDQPQGAAGAISVGLGRAGVVRLRTDPNQAAALRAADLSGDRYCDRAGVRGTGPRRNPRLAPQTALADPLRRRRGGAGGSRSGYLYQDLAGPRLGPAGAGKSRSGNLDGLAGDGVR